MWHTFSALFIILWGYHVIHCFCSPHHQKDVFKLYNCIKRVLRPGVTYTRHIPIWGLPQGSRLGPYLFQMIPNLWVNPFLPDINLNYQVYDDDNELYIGFHPMEYDSTQLAICTSFCCPPIAMCVLVISLNRLV